jgi:predicted nucleic acid-binding protein
VARVVDASVIVEWLTDGRGLGDCAEAALFADDDRITAWHCGAEVLHALRGLTLGHKLDPHIAAAAVEDFRLLDIEFLDTNPLLGRAFGLRHNSSAYDALYIALAEYTSALLVTCDGGMYDAAIAAGIAAELVSL